MRRKIKELMNKEEGFTLVELLAVIVILGIIVAIAIPAIGGVIDRAGKDATDAEQELVLDAARLYTISEEKKLSFPETGKTAISIPDDLIEEGYLEIKDGEEYTGSVIITKLESGNYNYKLDKFKKTTK